MNNSVFIDRLFGIPIYTSQIDSKEYDKSNIISTIEKNYNKNSYRNEWDSSSKLHHCYNDWNNKEFIIPDFSSLIEPYTKRIAECLEMYKIEPKCEPTFTIENYTCMGENDNMESHYHPGCDFTGVHYIQFDENIHTPTSYKNELPWIEYKDDLRGDLYNYIPNNIFHSWYHKWWDIGIKEDYFAITPSFVQHKVRKQKKSKKLRITIVVNISLS